MRKKETNTPRKKKKKQPTYDSWERKKETNIRRNKVKKVTNLWEYMWGEYPPPTAIWAAIYCCQGSPAQSSSSSKITQNGQIGTEWPKIAQIVQIDQGGSNLKQSGLKLSRMSQVVMKQATWVGVLISLLSGEGRGDPGWVPKGRGEVPVKG